MMAKLAAITTGMTLALAACKPAATAPAHDIPAAMSQTATTLLQSNQSGDATADAMESALAHLFNTVESMESAK